MAKPHTAQHPASFGTDVPPEPQEFLTPSAPPAHVRALPDYNQPPTTITPVFIDQRPGTERINIPDADVAAAVATVTGSAPGTHAPATSTHHCGLCGNIHAIGSCPKDSAQPSAFKRLWMCGTCGKLHWNTEACPV